MTRWTRIRGIAALIATTLALMAASHGAGASATSGGLMLVHESQDSAPVPAPLVATDVAIAVSGTIARTTVTQHFKNPGDAWVEGIYVFPLPERAAVDRLRMRVGDRFIEGRIEEREAARQRYETAKTQGRKASLVEQERPNVFTTNVANIGPGDTVSVRIEYQETVRLDEGRFHLRFPMVVGPRYNPEPSPLAALNEGRATDPVPDRARITPPVLPPESGRKNAVAITIRLDAGFPLGLIEAPHHAVDIVRGGDGRAEIALRDGETPANRDFELVWAPKAGLLPHASLFHEKRRDGDHLLIMLTPPTAETIENTPREAVFVIDVSGSMSGDSITQAKAALLRAVDRLSPRDSFNIIAFNQATKALFHDARPASRAHLAAARRFIRNLEANGGTALAPALIRALDARRTPGDNQLRQVVFLTDGAIGNEAQIFDEIARRLGDTRLFMVGIGSAPNAHLMRRAATLGRGSYTFIGDPAQVATRTDELLEKLERPRLTNIQVSWPEAIAMESYPARLPDLYHGEPVALTARLSQMTGDVTVSGDLPDGRWSATVDLANARQGDGVAALWAREKVAYLEQEQHLGADPAATRDAVLRLALDYDLVTRFTSLLAVDVTPSRPGDTPLASRDVPAMFPQGWEWAKVVGEARPRRKRAMQAPPAPTAMPVSASMTLPQTATPALLYLILGLVGLTLGGGLLVLRRREAVGAARG